MFAHHRIQRRKFLHWTLSAFFLSTVPWYWSCRRTTGKSKRELWLALAGTLFPGQPDVRQTGFYRHLRFVVSDKNYDPDIRRSLIDGFEQFEQFIHNKIPGFARLSFEKRSDWLKRYIRSNPQAENWLARVLTVIWEATLLDPHYGVNKKMIGWKWLHHPFGHPRPDATADYFSLLRKRQKSETIQRL